MMKLMLIARAFLPALALVVGLSVPGFGAGEEPNPCDYKAFGLDAGKFFLYLTKDTPYTKWRLWPDRDTSRPVEEPHGPFTTTYVNTATYESIKKKEKMAFGSLIVMENRGADNKLRNITARIKIKGYNPAGGDWYWFAFAPDGTATAEGKARSCIGCHGKGKANDYLMGSLAK